MHAAYNTRRSSVVLNPRGRVLNGLGQLGDEGGGGGDVGSGDGFGFDGGSTGNIGFDGGGEDGGAAAADAAAADAAMADVAAADAAAAAAAQAAAEAANIAAIDAAIAQMDASAASTAAAAKAAATIATGLMGKVGIIGFVAGQVGKSTGAFEAAFSALFSGNIGGFNSGLATASSALSDAGALAGGDAAMTAQINILQNNIDAAKKASINAAVTELYLRYAGRLPDVQGLNYWSKQFSPTITPDEVLVFTGTLYANEPHLRPISKSPTTPNTAQPGMNLALPLIAAVAGFLILGG